MNSSTKIALVITLLMPWGLALSCQSCQRYYVNLLLRKIIANHFGVLLAPLCVNAGYLCPLAWKMSDRFGRRPVLLLSLIGASLDYLLLVFSSAL